MSHSRKRKHQEITPEAKPIHVTSRSLRLFSTFHTEDKTNLTNNKRGVHRYNKHFDPKHPLTALIQTLAQHYGRKINILDAGCGRAHAIDELLSDESLKEALGSCTGISLHYFTDVETVAKKHGKRFQFYLGKVQDVMTKMHNQFDLIVDVAGAYLYSVDKLGLLKLYHQALTPQGIAQVYISSDLSVLVQHGKIQDSMITRLCTYQRDTFRLQSVRHSDRVSLIMTKTCADWPVAPVTVVSYQERSTIGQSTHQPLSLLRLGNAVSPYKTVVKLDDEVEEKHHLRKPKFS